MKSRPGIVIFALSCSINGPQIFLMTSIEISVAPICWVIAPASLSATAVPLILSSKLVLPGVKL